MGAETIYALASGRPPAAIAIIRISGVQAHEAGRALAGELPPPRAATLRALRHPQSAELLDQAILLRFDAPASATGDDLVELHCHGGRAIVDAILEALSGVPGLRLAQPGEFTRRAFENGRIDLTEAEGLADLLEAETEWQRRAAMMLVEGGLRRQVDRWRELLLSLAARAETSIDYADEDVDDVPEGLYRDCAAFSSELEAWLGKPRGEPLKQGLRVVLAGPPNAGKSSLFNALVGCERAIVADVPGTTRDYLEMPLALRGVPFVVTDTAGIREATDSVERIGVDRTGQQMECADILLWMGDAADAPEHECLIHVRPKADLSPQMGISAGQMPVSAHSGEGISELLLELERRARTLLPEPDAIALNRRQAEHLRVAACAVGEAAAAPDIVLLAEHLRAARAAFDRLTGRAGIEDVLDALFGRFCLGK